MKYLGSSLNFYISVGFESGARLLIIWVEAQYFNKSGFESTIVQGNILVRH